MMRFLNDLPCELTEYEEDYVRTLLEKITVYDDYLSLELKSKLTSDRYNTITKWLMRYTACVN